MIGYFDTSAVVPLVIAEESSVHCADIWQACDVRISSMLVVAEAYAALAQALRLGRLTQEQHDKASKLLGLRIEELDLVVPSREIVDSAAELARTYALRGYDAVHAATALALSSPDLVVISGDRALLDAIASLGASIVDINAVTGQ